MATVIPTAKTRMAMPSSVKQATQVMALRQLKVRALTRHHRPFCRSLAVRYMTWISQKMDRHYYKKYEGNNSVGAAQSVGCAAPTELLRNNICQQVLAQIRACQHSGVRHDCQNIAGKPCSHGA